MNHILVSKMRIRKFRASIKDREAIEMKAIKLSKLRVHCKEEKTKMNDADKSL